MCCNLYPLLSTYPPLLREEKIDLRPQPMKLIDVDWMVYWDIFSHLSLPPILIEEEWMVARDLCPWLSFPWNTSIPSFLKLSSLSLQLWTEEWMVLQDRDPRIWYPYIMNNTLSVSCSLGVLESGNDDFLLLCPELLSKCHVAILYFLVLCYCIRQRIYQLKSKKYLYVIVH